jgi:hypothetical protein
MGHAIYKTESLFDEKGIVGNVLNMKMSVNFEVCMECR